MSDPSATRYFLLSDAGGVTLVDVFSAATGKLQKTISLNQQILAAEITPDGRRLLLLGNLLYVFDITATDPVQIAALHVGVPSYDMAISLDSKRAFVTTATGLVGVDLASNPPAVLVATLPIYNRGLPMRVAAAPNGFIYVTASEQLNEIDGRSATGEAMVQREGISLSQGMHLGKPFFSADGKYLVASNTSAGPSIVRLDLATRALIFRALTFPIPGTYLFPDSNRFLGVSPETGGLYEIAAADINAFDDVRFNGQSFRAVQSAALSDEVPARTLWVSTTTGVSRVDLVQDRITASHNTPGAVAYVAPVSTAAVATVAPYSNTAATILPFANTIPLVIRALDAEGRPVFNAPVTWTAPGLTGQSPMTATNAQGFAQAVFTGSVEGVYTVTATAGAKSTTFQVTVSATGGTPGTNAGLRMIAGNGQVATVSLVAPVSLTVQLTDDDGNPVADETVTWRIRLPSGGYARMLDPSLACDAATSTASLACTTDAEGKSYVTFRPDYLNLSPGSNYLPFTITAEAGDDVVTFVETAIPFGVGGQAYPQSSIVANSPLRGRAGETLQNAIEVLVLNQVPPIAPLPNVGVRVESDSPAITASCVGQAGITLTDSRGRAVCNLVLGGGTGAAKLRVIVGEQTSYSGPTLIVDPGQASTIAALGGNNQAGNPGQTLPAVLAAQIRDAGGNPVPGASAQWSVLSGAATLVNTSGAANANGVVSTGVTLGATPGQVQIQVQSGTAKFVFTVTVNASVTGLTKIAGDNQTAEIGTAFLAPLAVQVTGATGPLPGIAVTFTLASGDATLSTPELTDANGRTSVVVTAGQTTGPIQITAAVGTQTQTFNLTARTPGPLLTAASFVNGASFQQVADGSITGITHGSIVSIIGEGLAGGLEPGACVSGNVVVGPLPTRVAGIEVEFGGTLSPIYHVCRGTDGKDQVTVQVPFPLGVPSTTTALFRTKAGTDAAVTTAVEGINLLASAPGIFEWTPEAAGKIAVAVRPDGSTVSPENPARKGETIRLYTTGLGISANPLTQTNTPGVPGQSLFQTPTVRIGGQGASGVTAEYAQNVIGIWIVTFQVPSELTVDANHLAELSVTVVDVDKTYSSQTSRIPIAQ